MNLALHTDTTRLWQSLEDISRFGATRAGGLHRLAASAEDGQARDFFVAAARDLGCTVRVDAVGNTFVRRAGTTLNSKAILIGSHLDSQPMAGKYDGTYGVMAGLEVLRALNEANVHTRHAVEVVCWTNEEGARFAPAMMGSACFAGRLSPVDALAQRDADGVSLEECLTAIRYAGTDVVSPNEFHVYLEAHIEQGPILQAAGLAIGVVTGVQGMCWYRVHLNGQAGHAGTYPMELRRDALTAAAQVISAVQQIGLAYPNIGRATVGRLDVTPNSPNVIPGQVVLMVEFRHPDAASLTSMQTELTRTLEEIAASTGVTVAAERVLDSPAVAFHPQLVDAVATAAAEAGLEHERMMSGAGHDACQVNPCLPTAMIFIPCDQGISHAEAEAITPEWSRAGADVLLRAVMLADAMDFPDR